jgi:electron transport complex protein RnfE
LSRVSGKITPRWSSYWGCPLLAVTSTATNALGLGLATTLVLTLTNLAISSLRRWTPAEIRIPIYVMIIASVVSAVQMLINAYAFGLYQSLGIFIPLIVTNCIVVGRAEAFAAKKGPALSALDGFAIGMGATCTMFVLGSIRELLGNGTLFDGADGLLGVGLNRCALSSSIPTRLPVGHAAAGRVYRSWHAVGHQVFD